MMAFEGQLQLLQEKLAVLERQINEYTVIDAELSTLPAGKAVYTRQASGLVFYKSDPGKTQSLHKLKLEELRREWEKLKQEHSKLANR